MLTAKVASNDSVHPLSPDPDTSTSQGDLDSDIFEIKDLFAASPRSVVPLYSNQGNRWDEYSLQSQESPSFVSGTSELIEDMEYLELFVESPGNVRAIDLDHLSERSFTPARSR